MLLPLLFGVGAACEPADHPPEWTLQAEETLVLGDENAAEDAAFYQPAALAFDGSGALYVLDSGNHRVQVFDVAGNYMRTLGRLGSGPGDLREPEDLWVSADGEVHVADTGNRRIARFGASGDPLPSVPLEVVPLGVVVTHDALHVLRLPAATTMFGPEEGGLVDTIPRNGGARVRQVVPARHEMGILAFLLNTKRITADPGGGFALADMHVHGMVRRFDLDGAEVGSFGVLYKAAAWAPLGRLPSLMNDDSIGRIARTCLDIHWDPHSNLFWVLAGYVDRLTDDTWVQGTEVYRYRADGSYEGTVPLPVSARSISVSPDRSLWVLDQDGAARSFRLRDPEGARAGR